VRNASNTASNSPLTCVLIELVTTTSPGRAFRRSMKSRIGGMNVSVSG